LVEDVGESRVGAEIAAAHRIADRAHQRRAGFLADIAGMSVHAVDESAAPLMPGDPAFALQHFERTAQGTPSDPELAGERTLRRHPAADTEFGAGDQLPQLGQRVVGALHGVSLYCPARCGW
jgi:hypothetical protein